MAIENNKNLRNILEKDLPAKLKAEISNGFKKVIEDNFGPIETMDPIDRDKLFKDLYTIYCDLMMREFQINLYVSRLTAEDLKNKLKIIKCHP